MSEVEEDVVPVDPVIIALAKLDARLDDIAHSQTQLLDEFHTFAQRLADFEAERARQACNALSDRVALDEVKSRLVRLKKFLGIYPTS